VEFCAKDCIYLFSSFQAPSVITTEGDPIFQQAVLSSVAAWRILLLLIFGIQWTAFLYFQVT